MKARLHGTGGSFRGVDELYGESDKTELPKGVLVPII